MKTLIIDTATEKGVAALYQGDRLVKELNLPEGQQSSTFLMPALSDLFSELNLKVSDLSLIGVGVGPGSYTGLRVGVTIAKAFSFACGIPLVGLNSLKGFVRETPGLFVSIIDARSCGFYVQEGERVNDNIYFKGGPRLVDLKTLMALEGVFVTPKVSVLSKKVLDIPLLERSCSHKILYEEAKSLFVRKEFSLEVNYF